MVVYLGSARQSSVLALLCFLPCGAAPGQAQSPAKAPARSKAEFDAKVTAALDRSRPILRKKLAKAHGGELALVCLAAVHDGFKPDDKTFKRALQKLSRVKLSRTYDVALRLMVAAESPHLPKRQALGKTDTARLLRNITNAGGFDYDRKARRWDLSNSQYGTLGLRAAVALGQKVPPKVWQGLIKSTVTAQNVNGGFSYMSGGRQPYSSMTVAGIVILKIAGDHVDKAMRKTYGIDQRIDKGWDFLADHKGDIGDRKTKNSFYFHYGLERACILLDKKDVDGKDWYRSGAEMLLRTQLKKGGWRSTYDHIQGGPDADGSDAVSTSFAILFLRRKFQKILKPTTPRASVTIATLGAQASAAQIAKAVALAKAQGKSAMPMVLRGLRSRLKPQRVAAAKALFAIAGQGFGFNPHVPPEKSKDAAAKAERWWLKSQGKAPKVSK